MTDLSFPIPAELLDAISSRVADRLADQLAHAGQPEPWLSVDEAAEVMRAPVSRVYDVVARGDLEVRRDGRRLLTKRSWIDAYLEGSQ